MAKPRISFLAFFLIWAKRRNWQVPDIHILACNWLETTGDLSVLRCFRGFGKSTILEVFNAWCYYCNPEFRILHQSESDKTAYKTSRGTQNVLRNHPLTQGMFRDGGIEAWWVEGSTDPRNASMYVKGILSNVTSARADMCQNDDVEVPKNIKTAESRENLRYRLGEQTHIMVPGGHQLFIGTPHTHDSIYDEMEAAGANCLTIKMFKHEHRIDDAAKLSYPIPFIPEFVFHGIGKNTRALEEGKDFRIISDRIVFAEVLGGLVDLYSGSAWPERFTTEEMVKRRKRTRTINEWDSQYQLHSKPLTQVRLNPEKIIAYDCQPEFRWANRNLTMWLGGVQIVSATAKWDPSSGKVNSDISSFSVMLQDALGRMYWHLALELTGEVAEFDDRGKVIGGQVWQICDVVEALNLPRVVVETNGIGGHTPAILRGAFKARGITAGITEIHETGNKNEKILQAYEPALSGKYLWAHVDVLDTVWDQMRDWNPAITNQVDDHLDSGAGAISEEPVRIGKIVGKPTADKRQDWRTNSGVYEVTLET